MIAARALVVQVLVRVAAFATGVLLGLLLAELAVRVLLPQELVTRRLRYAALQGPGYGLQPDTYLPGKHGGSINSLGLRGEELPPRSPGEHRVLVLGDSFTYGAGVREEETFVAHLELLAGPERTFVNGGTPSYGTERQVRWLRALGDQVAPDEVLLAFFVGNDITDNQDTRDPTLFDGQLVSSEALAQTPWRLRMRVWLLESHLYRLLDRRLERPSPPSEELLAFMAEPERVERHTRLRQASFLETEFARLSIYSREAVQSGAIQNAYALTEAALGGLRDWCRDHGTPLSVAILPDVVQVDPGVLEGLTKRRPALEAVRLDLERPQRFVRDWCEREGVPVVDLTPALRPLGAAAYLERDTHFSAQGHRAAAEGIARELYGAP